MKFKKGDKVFTRIGPDPDTGFVGVVIDVFKEDTFYSGDCLVNQYYPYLVRWGNTGDYEGAFNDEGLVSASEPSEILKEIL